MPYQKRERTPRLPRSVRPVEDREPIGTGEHINPRKLCDAYARRGISIRLDDADEHLLVEPADRLSVSDLVRLSTFKANLRQYLSGSRRRI
jgi:hypothetical protein